jgi:hypothetical protein
MPDVIINKVAESGLVSLDLEDFLPEQGNITGFDLKDFLFMGQILKEKDYRASLQALDWTPYEGKSVALHCSADAIIPAWAYMLAATYLEPLATEVYMGTEASMYKRLIVSNIEALSSVDYQDKRVVVKGCGDKVVPAEAYVAITLKLRPVAKSIMYGEPCSTVPVFKKK